MKIKKTTQSEKKVANLQLVKETNLALIFNLISSHQSISRAELANITKLSPTTVSSLTQELLDNNMIIQTGEGTSETSGRKPIMLEVDPKGGYVVAVEIADYGFYISLFDIKCQQVGYSKHILTQYDAIGDEIINVLSNMLNENNVDEDKLLGVCIGIPGLIDAETNKVVSTVVPIDESNDFYNVIKDRFPNIPVKLGNESSFYAYAEKEFGIGKNVDNLVFMDINVGIGSGILIGGHIYTGALGYAGEIGHVSIDLNGPRCKCGNRGCLEIMANIPALLQRVIFAIMSGRNTIIKDITSNDFNRINIDVIKSAMDLKDGLVLEVVDDTARMLAFGLNNVINMINPQMIVLGGDIITLGDEFLNMIKSHLSAIVFKHNASRVQIKYSSVGGNAVTLGGARYVLDNIFKFRTEGFLGLK